MRAGPETLSQQLKKLVSELVNYALDPAALAQARKNANSLLRLAFMYGVPTGVCSECRAYPARRRLAKRRVEAYRRITTAVHVAPRAQRLTLPTLLLGRCPCLRVREISGRHPLSS